MAWPSKGEQEFAFHRAIWEVTFAVSSDTARSLPGVIKVSALSAAPAAGG